MGLQFSGENTVVVCCCIALERRSCQYSCLEFVVYISDKESTRRRGERADGDNRCLSVLRSQARLLLLLMLLLGWITAKIRQESFNVARCFPRTYQLLYTMYRNV